MNTRPSDLIDPILLAARAAAVFTCTHRLAYAYLAPDLTFVWASANFEKLLDSPKMPIEGQLLTDRLWGFIGAENDLLAVLHGQAADYTIEQVNHTRPDGSLAYLTYRVTRLEQEGETNGLLLVIEDVTEASILQQHVTQDRNELRLVQAQLSHAIVELQRLNRFKSFVLSMAAHDLRSPLTVVRGYADLLLKALERGKPVDREALATILTQADRLNQMIANLLNLDQIEHGQLVVKPVPCDLNELIRDVAKTISPMATLGGLSLVLDLPAGPTQVFADPDRVRQILQNVMSNAVKYTPPRGRVDIVARPFEDEAILRVTDTGPGMTAGQVARLFQPYYRTDEARDSTIEGSGLGLFIVKTLVDAQHGAVAVDSEPGRGTTLTLTLPLAQFAGDGQDAG
jgi:signal transduction histidine kinase